MSDLKVEILDYLIFRNKIKLGSYKLKSGITSPYMVDLSICSGEDAVKFGEFYYYLMKNKLGDVECLYGPSYKGIGLTYSAATELSRHGIRKNVLVNIKGSDELVGAYLLNNRVAMVDDVVTHGTSIKEAVDIFKPYYISLTKVFVLFDRRERYMDNKVRTWASEMCENYNLSVYSLLDVFDLIEYLGSSGDGWLVKKYADEHCV